MKIRMTVLLENGKHLDETKEKIEATAKKGYQKLFDLLSNGIEHGNKATVETCELVEA